MILSRDEQADKEYFQMLYDEGKTPDYIASLDCVWMSGEDIAQLLGVEYIPGHVEQKYPCRVCGRLTINRFRCPACWNKTEKQDVGSPAFYFPAK